MEETTPPTEGASAATSHHASRRVLAERVQNILNAPMPECLQLAAVPRLQPCSTLYLSELLHPVPAPRPSAAEGGKPIYELLLEKGRLATERREQLVSAAMAAEVKELRPAPTLTGDAARPPLPPPGSRIEDKLLRRARERQEELERRMQLRAEAEAEAIAAAPFRPQISARGAKAKPRYTTSPRITDEWRRQRKDELDRARGASEESELRDRPAINNRSARLADRQRRREGLEKVPTGEALLLRAEAAKLKRMEKAALADTPDLDSARRTEGRRSSSRDACERLYTDHFTVVERRLAAEADLSMDAPFAPRITARGAAVAPRYKSHTGTIAEAADEPPFRPVIDPVSAAIARQLSESTECRLLRSHRKHASSDEEDTDDSTTATSHHRVSSLPQHLADTFAAYEERRRMRLQQLCDEAEWQTQVSCSFAPRINRYDDPAAEGTVAERSSRWLQRREEKLEALRQQQAESQQHDSAQRQRHAIARNYHHHEDSHRSRSNTSDPGYAVPWGTQEFAARMRAARLQHESVMLHRESGRPYSSASSSSPPLQQPPLSAHIPTMEGIYESIYGVYAPNDGTVQ